MTAPRAHDLLRIGSITQLCRSGPAWVTPALQRTPWVVIRRARCRRGYLPVGIRGPNRSQRHPALIERNLVRERLAPPDLIDRFDRLPELPVTETLRSAADLLATSGLRWGPGGSVGFTLATGVLAVTPSSDLDLVVIADDLPPIGMLGDLAEALRTLPSRVDCQLDLPVGGVALDELVGGGDQVLVRTDDGPMLRSVDRLAS